ncbi:TMEM175 family protein [Deinococcus apachensis]|uniref:TMEM175 family protein n=1 Tax=Deinococcus apachensis TaxID=309886 RepID=UPI0003695C9D|nr:TMEM175 family protein [Deinococcus apachensis]
MAELPPGPQDVPASRVHSLSDGVFAIVMTLLVLELRVPEQVRGLGQVARDARLAGELVTLAPRLVIYAFTFIIAGLNWLSHVRFQRYVRRTDQGLALRNVVYLMLVSLLPFSSGLIGAYGDTPAGVATYALNQVLIGAAFLWMLRHAVQHGLMAPDWRAQRLGERALVNLGGFVLMAVLAFVRPSLAWLAPFAPFVGRLLHRAVRKAW